MPSPLLVTDPLSNWNDQIATAARLLGRGKDRQAVFEAVYRGKKQVKTVREIMDAAGLSQVRVLQEGRHLAGLLLVKVKNGYQKKPEFAPRYRQILDFARNKGKLNRLATKIGPKGVEGKTIQVTFPRLGANARFIGIDDLDSFDKARRVTPSPMRPMAERKLKAALARIIGERGSFKDWGGEKSDLYSTRVRMNGKRITTAIAFKGKATKGKLVPGKMGKNGDQINRLFDEPAQAFLVVYCGQVDSSIIAQMKAFAIGNAMRGQRVYYGVVDGSDISRLRRAYPNCF